LGVYLYLRVSMKMIGGFVAVEEMKKKTPWEI
jgi:hypothetical protein